MFNNYLERSFETSRKDYSVLADQTNQNRFERTIRDLRALKYARVLLSSIYGKLGLSEADNIFVFVDVIEAKSNKANKLFQAKYTITLGTTNKAEIKAIIDKLTTTKPLSKFGIEPLFRFVKTKKINPKNHYSYTRTNTHSYVKGEVIKKTKCSVFSTICVDLDENDYK